MPVFIVSIHDENADGTLLAVDLRDIVGALGDVVDRLRWCILDLEATGARVAALHARVDAAPERRLWLSGAELRAAATAIDQTIDAHVAGYPLDVDTEALDPADVAVAHFPTNRMALVIAAIDSTSFEVYGKDAALADRVAGAFRQVRREDPADYFGP